VTSLLAYTALIAVTAAERLVEMALSRRNAAWSRARGGYEVGAGHFPVMVLLHTGFLVACLAEVWGLGRSFVPAIGWPLIAVAVLSQALRWWCITTLGPQWNTRVFIVPGAGRVTGGPYRWFNHPNYVAVVTELAVLPLIHGAWVSALVFSAANGVLLWWRIRVEDRALAALSA